MKQVITYCFVFVCSTAFGHPSFEKDIVIAGSVFKANMMVTHGCGDSPTIKLEMDVPEDVLAITPRVMSGWKIERVESKLSEPRTVFGMERTKYISRLIWSGGSLSSDYFDVFSFVVVLPHDAMTLYFPTTQYCVTGVDAYTGVPDSAKPDKQPQNMAPSLKVIESESGGGH